LYYTYLHLNESNKPIYVGKGKGDRAYQKRNYNEPYTVKIVHNNISESQALEFEEFLIQEIGIDNLYNVKAKGCISGVITKIDYNNFKSEVKRILSLPTKEVRKYASLIIDDAIKGNDIAMQFIIKRAPLDILLKIKELIKKNSDNLWSNDPAMELQTWKKKNN
jgi:hypothetical protein